MKTQQLIDRVLGGSQYLWSSLVMQARIDNARWMGIGVFVVFVGLLIYKHREQLGWDRDIESVCAVLAVVAWIVGGCLVLWNVDGVLFPAGTAAQWLVQSR